MTSFSLRTVRLRPGEEHREQVALEIEPFDLGRQRYEAVPAQVPAELAISRATSGDVFALSLVVRLHGPCMRCLTDTVLDVAVDAREYHAADPGAADELRSEYVVDDRLELSRWARDVVALELPDPILCRPDCAGLCPVCGVSLNESPHVHDDLVLDPRWAALEKLRERL
jgi:uncharacterized protein